MAKIMAMLNGNEVVNVSVFSDSEVETPTMVNCGDLPVGVGDTYEGGHFYRDGNRLRSDDEIFDEMAAKVAAVEEAGITIAPKPTTMPTKPGYPWRAYERVLGRIIWDLDTEYHPDMPGTVETPIEFEDGMKVYQNYNYQRDGHRKVWFGAQEAQPTWDDTSWYDPDEEF